jgi:3-hexulose-6-phosphate synthase/6-phospho-3-hexuloisomerase
MTNPYIVQVSIDVTTQEEALKLAHGAVRAGVDWLEAGTPLLLAEGLHAVRALRAQFPGVPIVADIKAMDGAGLEAEMAFKVGANLATVMGQAHDASIIAQVEMARRYGAQVMCDLMNCPDKPGRARQVQQLGVDYIIVHTGLDERTRHPHLSPLDDLPAVLDAVDIPVQAAGGLSIEQAIQTLELGAELIVIGAPLVIGGAEPTTASPDFEPVLRDIVHRVRDLQANP